MNNLNNLANNNAQIDSLKNKIKKPLCEISINNVIKGLGTLIIIPIKIEGREPFGILTSYKNLSRDQLKKGCSMKLNFKFNEPPKIFYYIIQENDFVFACDFNEVSFLEIPYGLINDIEPLNLYKNPIGKEEMLVCQTKQGNNFDISKGNIIEKFGANLLFNVNDPYENNAVGTPLISLSKESLGQVIGLKVDNYLSGETRDKFSALNINTFIECIEILVNSQRIRSEKTLSEPKRLSLKEKHKLKEKGLIECKELNNLLFESPASQSVTSLWFYRTHYAWFWTPTKPNNFNKEELLKCNWSLIKENFPIIAIGGLYNGFPPAPRNEELIHYLISSKLDFLSD